MPRKATRKRARRTTSRRSPLTSSQKNLKLRQSYPWDRLKKEGFDNPVIYSIPWEERGVSSILKAKNFPGIGYVSQGISKFGEDYICDDYSWESYIVSKVSGFDGINPDGDDPERFVLRDDQKEDISLILEAYSSGCPEFLIANKTGTGKTVTAWSSIRQLQPSSVLIVCPAPVIPVWRQHIKDMGDGGINIVVINYESLKKMVRVPDKAVSAKKAATQNKNIALYGTPYEAFDMVVIDEAHKMKNPTSQQSRIVSMFSDSAKFTLKLTATPGKDPSQLHHLWRGLSWSTGDDVKVVDDKDFSSYTSWCKKHGIGGIVPAPFGNGISWNGKKSDLEKMSEIIYGESHGGVKWATKRKIFDDSVVRQSLPIELSREDRDNYDKVVEDATKSILSIKNNGKKDTTKGLAALVSLRQKSGVMKSPTVVDYAEYCIKDLDEQVVVTTCFHNTTDTLSEILDRKGIDYVVIDGTMNSEEKEQARTMFQTGEVPIVITSVTTGISLHANENSSASSNQRRMIVTDLQWSPVEHIQLEGRINRNGENGVITIPYLEGTIDEKVTKALMKGMSTQSVIQGDNSNVNDIMVFADALGINLDIG